MAIEDLLTLYAIMAGVSDPIRKLSNVNTKIQRASAASDRICALMDREPQVADAPNAVQSPVHRRTIEFDGVHFAYPGRDTLLTGIDLTVRHGETVALVGPNGCGKSTLMNLLPDWAVGEGGVRIGTLDPVELARIGNPFEGAATAAGAAAADAFSAALSQTYLEPPDLGLGAMADDARGRADGYREAAGMLADAAGRPLASWQALRDAVTGTGSDAETALADAASSADALNTELDDTAAAAGSAGAAAREAGAEAATGADQAATGWGAVTAALADYANKARNIS